MESQILFKLIIKQIEEFCVKNHDNFKGIKKFDERHELILRNSILPIIEKELKSKDYWFDIKLQESGSHANNLLRTELEEYFPQDFYPDLELELRIKKCFENSPVLVIQLQKLIISYYQKLNIMKENRSKWEEENWTDAEIQESNRLIVQLAGTISDLNKIIK